MLPEQVCETLRAYKFPVIFEKIQVGQISGVLQSFCMPPRMFHSMTLDPELKEWLPLWEFEDEEVVAFNSKNGTYWQYDYLSEEKELVAQNYQQLVTTLFLEIYDAGLDDCLDELSKEFEYKYIANLRKFFSDLGDRDFYIEAKTFVSSLA